jgi:hypothetical protein
LLIMRAMPAMVKICAGTTAGSHRSPNIHGTTSGATAMNNARSG